MTKSKNSAGSRGLAAPTFCAGCPAREYHALGAVPVRRVYATGDRHRYTLWKLHDSGLTGPCTASFLRRTTLSLFRRMILPWAWARRRVRASEWAFIALSVLVGAGAGLASILLGAVARTLQHWLFALPSDVRLSAMPGLTVWALLALPLGGVALAAFSWAVRSRRRRLVDAVEANALHGGRMSMTDSLVISGQTVLSNGFGASVGLEAAYAQMGGAIASVAGSSLRLRRADLRNLVGAGAGAAIAAAFGAPLAGAFYAFEIVIGAYTPSAIAPVVAATLTAVFVSQAFGVQPYVIDAAAGGVIETHHYLIYAGLGAICAALGIGLMRAVALVETATRRIPAPGWSRPVIGGALLACIAVWSPQVLSSGHGALHVDLAEGATLGFIAIILIAKSVASIVSLGFGFRGGLFFASLFLGTLVGHLFAGILAAATGVAAVDAHNAALVGRARGRHRRRTDDHGDARAGGDPRLRADRSGAGRVARLLDDRPGDVRIQLLDLAAASPR